MMPYFPGKPCDFCFKEMVIEKSDVPWNRKLRKANLKFSSVVIQDSLLGYVTGYGYF